MACISKAWFSSNIHHVKVLALASFLYLCSPLILLLILLLCFYRKCISIWAKLWDSDLSDIISPASALLANDDLYGIPNNNVVTWFVLKGSVSIDSLQSVIYEKVLEKQSAPASSSLVYPQLKQYPVRFCKFLFWKWESEFKIEAHIHTYDKARDENKSWGESEILEIQRNLLRKQWSRHQSPWEIFLVPNYRPNNSSAYRDTKTIMFLRFHECLGDSFSWFQLFVTNLCDCDNVEGHRFPKHVKEVFPPDGDGGNWFHSQANQVIKFLKLPFKIPFDFAKQALEPKDVNEWNVPEFKLIKRDHLKIIDRFSVQHIKDIKSLLGVSFTSVLISACTAAIRTTFISMGIKIPRTIKVAFPILQQCQCEDKLGNYLSICYLKLPVGIASARERLRMCEDEYSQMRQSSVPISNIYIRHMMGLLPYKYFKPLLRNQPRTGAIVNLPASFEYVSINDHPIEDFGVSSIKDSGFSITFLSYADSIRMSLVVDHRLIPAERQGLAKDLLKNTYAELIVLGIEGIV